jgi:hypothetical protein
MELADRRDAAGGFFDTGCAVTCATVLMTSANGPTRIPAPRLRLEPLGLRPAESRHPGAHRRSMAEMRMSGLTLDIKATFRKSPVREPRKRKRMSALGQHASGLCEHQIVGALSINSPMIG